MRKHPLSLLLHQPPAEHKLYKEVARGGDQQEGVDAVEQTAVARQERPGVLLHEWYFTQREARCEQVAASKVWGEECLGAIAALPAALWPRIAAPQRLFLYNESRRLDASRMSGSS